MAIKKMSSLGLKTQPPPSYIKPDDSAKPFSTPFPTEVPPAKEKFNITNFFSNKIYHLDNGTYRALITHSEIVKQNGKEKWIIEFTLEDGLIFVVHIPSGRSRYWGFAKAILELSKVLGTVSEQMILNKCVTITIKNKEKDGTIHSNIDMLRFEKNEEEENLEDEIND